MRKTEQGVELQAPDPGPDGWPATGMKPVRKTLGHVVNGQHPAGPNLAIDAATRLPGQAFDEIRFNRELLRATLEHLSQGVSVVDQDLRLVAWNRRYIELFAYPPWLITLGRPIADVLRYNAERGLISPGEGDIETWVRRRMSHMRRGNAYSHERVLPNGTVIEIRGNPMPGHGFVASYSDVTAYKRAQAELLASNETLEQRVAERTAELLTVNAHLSEAKLVAERANQAKTRFLASASHDLVQPLNAARLFVASIDRRQLRGTEARLVCQVEDSLASAESLLGALLDISRLDAGVHELKSEHFELRHLMEPLSVEFAALARNRGLEFRMVPTRAVVDTDPWLLRRVLQNFLCNAIRYTCGGRVLMGCRRLPGGLRIEVWDTGPGIPANKQREIFEEFRRLDSPCATDDRGLGLGLAIAERLTRLMGHPLGLRSKVGKGSVFFVTVPFGDRQRIAAPPAAPAPFASNQVQGALILCLDNEPSVLEGMKALLGGWGAEVLVAACLDSALALFATCGRNGGRVPDLVLLDYHLDSGTDGIGALEPLKTLWKRDVPAIIITADHTQQARAAAERNGYPMLRKPLKPAALRALVSQVLGGR